MEDAVSYWDTKYSKERVEAPDTNDPVLVTALEHFGGDVNGRRLLDLGCGDGKASLFFADRGASVVSVDTSDAAISNLKAYCADHDIHNVSPMRMSAAGISEVGPFDFIFGSMILHHVEPFGDFARTLRLALRPEGRAFFYENNASPPLMWFREHVVGRLWVPKYGDEEESPLTPGEIGLLTEHFRRVEVFYPWFVFFSLIPPYLSRGKGQRLFQRLDELVYRVPRLRRYSYRQYVLLS